VVRPGHRPHHARPARPVPPVTLLAEQRLSRSTVAIPLPAWSRKDRFTFAEALALVRRELRAHQACRLSADATDAVKVPRVLIERLTDALCDAT
jgi:hypothetical protein